MSSKRQFVLGVFFVVAASILAFYTLFLTEFSLLSDPIRMTIDFPDAHALRDGDPVLVAGKRIGRVKTIVYRPQAPRDKRIRVDINLDEPIELLADYTITIEESTFLGGRNIDIDPGPFGGPAAQPGEDGAYRGTVQENPIAALKAVGDLVAENKGSVNRILSSLDQTMLAVREGDGLAHRLVFDDQLATDVALAAADFRATAADMRASITRVQTMLTNAQEGQGTLGKLLTDETLYEDAVATVDSLRTLATDLEAGKGALGALLSDEELEAELRGIVTQIATLAKGIEAGDGLIGKLLKDEALAAEVDKLVRTFVGAGEDIRGVVANLQSSDGTLGKLLNDPALYDEALTALKVLTRSLEDYREAAPVSAFTGAIFGAL